MILRSPLLAILVLTVAALPAAALGFTDYAGRTRGQFQRVISDGEGDPAASKLVKAAAKAVKAIDSPKLAVSYDAELKGMAKAAKTAEKSFAADAALMERLDALVDLYAADIEAARAALAVDAGGGNPAAAKALGKVDKALAKVLPEMPASGKLKGYAKAAKALGAYLVTGAAARDAHFAVSSAAVAPLLDGHDFTGDMAPDNALQAVKLYLDGIGFDLDAALADSVSNFTVVALVSLWDIQSFDADAEVWFGVLNGLDDDGDTADNFLGFESFQAVQAPNPLDDRPLLRGSSPLGSGGSFDAPLNGPGFEIAEMQTAIEAPPHLRGDASSASITGVLSVVIWADTLLDWLELKGVAPEHRANLQALVDIDLDGDMAPDGFSCAFTITGVPAEIRLP